MYRKKESNTFSFHKMSLVIGGAIASIISIHELHVIIGIFHTIFLILKNTVVILILVVFYRGENSFKEVFQGS